MDRLVEESLRSKIGENVRSSIDKSQTRKNWNTKHGKRRLSVYEADKVTDKDFDIIADSIKNMKESNKYTEYKKHLNTIDSLLPYYLKSLEVLVQHYTVPVALARSIEDAPEVFKPGLRDLVAKIEAGDSSVDPYMDFANQYPVRDSMRMMRLLYRLSLGEQDKKHEQMLSFSKTVSSLQLKAREQKYKARLNTMESQTMKMLVCTGCISLILMLIASFSVIFG